MRVKTILIGTAILGLAFSSSTIRATEGPTYLINVQDVTPELTREDGGYARISFDYEWSSSRFPGAVSCQWTVKNAAGDIIGTQRRQMSALGLKNSATVLIPVHGVPENASATCSSTRQDNPSGHWEVSDVAVESQSAKSFGQEVWISFKAIWVGGGIPSPQDCRLFFRNSEG